jgi:hypothetical protein
VKPLDLNVGIQNSYEAARVESVRLEKEHVLNRLAGEDSVREQRLRDAQVNPPEAKILHDDLFSAEAYEALDYTARGDSGKKKQAQGEAAPSKSEAVSKSNEEKTQPSDSESQSHGFSTYA